MLGSQNNVTNSNNPFTSYQTFYLTLYTNVLGPNEEGYQKGVNDTAHFRVSLRLDDNQKKHNNGQEYLKLPNENKIGGFLKSISLIKDVVNGKETEKFQITLFDPNSTYVNPFQNVDTNNPRNGKTVGAVYIIKTSPTLKGKELMQKLANVDPNSEEMITITVGKAYCAPDYKEPLVKDGKQIYNIYVKQGDDNIGSRFGDPSKSSKIKADEWNKEYLEILENPQNKQVNELMRINMNLFYGKFIKTVCSELAKKMFLKTLNQMGYDLVENGVDKDGIVKFKYVSIGSDVDVATVTNYEPVSQVSTKQASDDEDSFVEPSGDDDLPF